MPQRVLVTGSAGRLGRAAVKALVAVGHTVVGFDLRATPGLPEPACVVGSLLDDTLLRTAIAGADCLIHLAATPDDAIYPRRPAPDDGDNFESELLPNNILAGYRVLDAARKAGVRRVILASTGQVIDGHLDDHNTPVTVSAPFRPKYLYACTKVFLEAVGQVYALHHGMSVLAVRLGWCPRDAVQVGEIRADAEAQDVYLSPGDAGRFFAVAVDATTLPPFAVVNVTSRPVRHRLYDLEPTRQLVGFAPQDQWPTGAEDF